MHTENRSSWESHSFWLRSSRIKSPLGSPAASRDSVSSLAWNSTFFTRSVMRLVSHRQMRASAGRQLKADAGGVSPGSSAAGSTRAESRFLVRRWVVVSKDPRESISSSKNSQRTGSSIRGENTSRMPPRRANWPTPSTWSQRVYPAATSRRGSSERSHRPPISRVRALSRSRWAGAVFWRRPSAVQTTSRPSPFARA